ncbi:hypothetical protein GCM10008171_08580 [Methylopila jiangsuensis]|uniref:Uncharacterized protein n=2 Tax=Methylopila jiangsuensis TaxID=586230 RepID=A0A9W6JH07_9HYPH|nr:hypothetical protein GCM10008171_08580 [Methylopila jiangsuensis]
MLGLKIMTGSIDKATLMPRSLLSLTALAATLAASFAFAQTPPPPSPSPKAPQEKLSPDPIRPDETTPPQAPSPAPPPEPDAPAPSEEPEPEASADDPLGVAANVTVARVASPWSTADGKGFSRVIGVIDGTRKRFYAQWLTEPDGRVIETREIEDNDAARLTFGDIRAERGSTGGVTLFLDTQPDRDGLRDTWVLILGAPGEIRFGPAMN